MEPVLKVQGLHKHFKVRANLFVSKQLNALSDVSFCLAKGETLAITGETGSGKSTLGKVLAGADNANRGQILLNGCIIEDNGNRIANTKDIRMIFQDAMKSLNPSSTIAAILNEILVMNTDLDPQKRLSKINDTLLNVGLLAEHRHYYAHMFSVGQIQRVALARAIILDPKVLVLDEALSALDPSVRAQTVNLLLRLQRETGLSYVLITNHLSLVKHMSDNMLILHKGKVVEHSTTADLFANPQTKLAKRMIAC
jgi:cationic peptide transport system ATP-binding protein